MNYPEYAEKEIVDGAIKKMQAEVTAVNTANGWFDSVRTFGEDIALLHSEISEMLEAFREHGLEDATKLTHEFQAGEPMGACGVVVLEDGTWVRCLYGREAPIHDLGRTVKPEGVGSEAADLLIRLLDTCERWNIDLAYEYERKIEFNRTRGYRHGDKKL